MGSGDIVVDVRFEGFDRWCIVPFIVHAFSAAAFHAIFKGEMRNGIHWVRY